MKEIYDYRFEYRLEGQKEFVDTSIWRQRDYKNLRKKFKKTVDKL